MQKIVMPGLHELPASVPKSDRAEMRTMLITPDKLGEWPLPGIQRPLVISNKVKETAAEMQLEAAKDPKEACCTIKGIVWLGRVGKVTYLVDGQHRLYGAFLLASRELQVHGGVLVLQALVDVGVRTFASMSELAESFIDVNSQLNRTKADDIMRALAATNEHLQAILQAVPFVGHDLTKENKKTTLLSTSSAIRTWFGSGGLTPASGPPAEEIVRKFLDEDQANAMIEFYRMTMEAGWNNDAFRRLYGSLNLGINMWLYRRVVLGEASRVGVASPMVLTREQYIVCMRSLLEVEYLTWLGGRSLRFQDRPECYAQLKARYAVALKKVGVENARFPTAQW